MLSGIGGQLVITDKSANTGAFFHKGSNGPYHHSSGSPCCPKAASASPATTTRAAAAIPTTATKAIVAIPLQPQWQQQQSLPLEAAPVPTVTVGRSTGPRCTSEQSCSL